MDRLDVAVPAVSAFLGRDAALLSAIHERAAGSCRVVLPYTADRVAWLKARHDGIGASEVAAVLSISKFESPYSLWRRKTGAPPEADTAPSEAAEWGLELEELVCRRYARKTGRLVVLDGSILASVRYPWLRTTLDAWCSADGGETWMPLEIKTTNAFAESDWENGTPDYYAPQLATQRIVTGVSVVSNACLIGGQKFVWDDTPTDESLETRVVHLTRKFWEEHVILGEAPEVDDHEATKRAIAEAFPEDDGGSVTLDADHFAEVADRIVTLKAEKKAIESELEALENEVKLALGSNELGRIPGVGAFTWSTQSRKETVQKACTFRVLRFKPQK